MTHLVSKYYTVLGKHDQITLEFLDLKKAFQIHVLPQEVRTRNFHDQWIPLPLTGSFYFTPYLRYRVGFLVRSVHSILESFLGRRDLPTCRPGEEVHSERG